MIVSASYRTDIPAFYADWFLARLKGAECKVANPYGGPRYLVSLRPGDVDGFVFWTRNAEKFQDALGAVAGRGLPFVVQFTLTGYPRALEASTPGVEAAVGQMRRMAREFGARVVVWRYDPVILTSLTPAPWHGENFARLASRLEGCCDEVVISFAQIYRKTRRNLNTAAKAHGFEWRDPEADEKRAVVGALAAIAAGHGMDLTLCSQPDYLVSGTSAARCIDAARLSDIAGRAIAAPRRGNRPGCECHRSRDIGAYDTCPHGCVYCYAVGSRRKALRNFRRHDKTSPILCPAPAGPKG